MQGLAKLTKLEAKVLFLRDPVVLLVALAVPIGILLVFGLPGFARDPAPELGGQRGGLTLPRGCGRELRCTGFLDPWRAADEIGDRGDGLLQARARLRDLVRHLGRHRRCLASTIAASRPGFPSTPG